MRFFKKNRILKKDHLEIICELHEKNTQKKRDQIIEKIAVNYHINTNISDYNLNKEQIAKRHLKSLNKFIKNLEKVHQIKIDESIIDDAMLKIKEWRL